MKPNPLKTTGLVLTSLGLAIVATAGVRVGAQPLLGQVLGESTQLAQAVPAGTSFLPNGNADGAAVLSPLFQVNIPAVFTDTATLLSLIVEEESVFNGQARFVDEVILENGIQLGGDLTTNGGVDIDIGAGTVTASNLVYSVLAGSGITVSGDQDITITNSDRGSDQKIFKSIKVGSDTASAGSNTDTFEFSAGDGIGLSLNTSDKKLTLTASNLSGWYKASSSNVALITSTNNVGIGTSSPSNKLEIDSGTDGQTGITFTRVTSSTAAGVGGGKVLSVDSGGKIILVEDQTGGGGGATPSAEAVLPSATSGMTIYYNGTNWVSSNNLYHDGGSVGISTTNPLARFQVNSNLASKIGAIFRGYTSQSANLTEWQDVNGNVLSYIDSNGVFNGTANVSGSLNPGLTNGSVLFQGASGITQDNSSFFWDDTNNRLGIGTSAPSAKLHVVSAGTASPDFLLEDNTSGAQLEIKGAGVNNASFKLTRSTNSWLFNVDAVTSDALQYYYNGSEKLRISSTGYVSIGTTSSSYGLEVATAPGVDVARFTRAGQAYVIVQSGSSPANSGLKIADQAGVKWSLINNDSSSDTLVISGDGGLGTDDFLSVNQSGFVGIGTGNASGAKLHIYGSSTANLRFEDTSQTSDYAFYTGIDNTDSFGLFDVDASAYRWMVNALGNIGIGTTAPTALLHVNGGYGANDAFTVNQTLGGNILSASASGATKLVLTNGGNLGIGTSNPTSSLYIYGTNSQAGGIVLKSTSNDLERLAIYANGGGSTAIKKLVTGGYINFLDAAGNTEVMFDDVGNVGIGTTDPLKMLDMYAAASATAPMLLLRDADVAGVSGISFLGDAPTSFFSASEISSTGGGAQLTGMSDTDTGGLLLNGIIGSADPTDTTAAIKLVSYKNNGSSTGVAALGSSETALQVTNFSTALMTILGNGNVGIGTAAPSARLDIGDGSTADQGIEINGGTYATIRMQQAGSSKWGIILNNSAANNDLSFYSYAASTPGTKVYFDKDGNVGIGTTNPDELLHVSTSTVGDGAHIGNAFIGVYNGDNSYSAFAHNSQKASNTGYALLQNSGGATFLNAASGQDLDFRIANASKMILKSTGLVGIGTTAPTALLHVEGGYGANDALTINQTLSGNILSASASGATKFVIANGGNVGIGTSVPSRRLDIVASGLSTNNQLLYFKQSNANVGFSWNLDDQSTGRLFLKAVGNDTPGVETELMAFDRILGNVGIGTTAPTNITGGWGGSDQRSRLWLSESNTSRYTALVLAGGNSSAGGGAIQFTDSSGSPIADFGTANGSEIGFAARQAVPINFYTSTGNKMTILSGGNVGVGTTTAPSKLTVAYDATLSYPNLGTSAYGNIHLVPTNDTNGNSMGISFGAPVTGGRKTDVQAGIYVQGSGDFNSITAGTRMYFATTNNGFPGAIARMSINELGYVGIGTTDAGAPFQYGPSYDGHVRGNGGSLDIRYDTSSRVYLSQNMGLDSGFGYNTGGIRIQGQSGGNYGYIVGGRGDTVNDIAINPHGTGNLVVGSSYSSARMTVVGGGTTTGSTLNVTDVNGNSGLYVRDDRKVGIGTTSPAHLLHLTGSATGKALVALNETGTNDLLTASASGVTKFLVKNSGRIGIGTDNPEGYVHILRSSSGRGYSLDGNDTLVLEQLGTNRIKWVGGNTDHQLLSFSDSDNEDSGVIAYHHDTDSMGFATNTVTALRIDSAQNVGLLPTLAFGTNASRVFAIASSTAPTTSITDGVQLFAVDVAGSHELQVRDEAGNVTTLSPHNFTLIPEGRSEDLAWAFYSERGGLAINADMTKALRLVEKLSGEQLIYLKDLKTGQEIESNFADSSPTPATTEKLLASGEINSISRWSYQLWTFIGKVVFEKPAEFLADVTFRGRVYLADKDAAGFAVIKAGDSEVKVIFDHEFITTPVVTVSPQKAVAGLRVEAVSGKEFIIKIDTAASEDVTINWVAVAVVDARTISSPGQGSTTEPAASATSSPSPTPSPTVAGTSTEVSPSPESSPSPVATPLLQPSPTPDITEPETP